MYCFLLCAVGSGGGAAAAPGAGPALPRRGSRRHRLPPSSSSSGSSLFLLLISVSRERIQLSGAPRKAEPPARGVTSSRCWHKHLQGRCWFWVLRNDAPRKVWSHRLREIRGARTHQPHCPIPQNTAGYREHSCPNQREQLQSHQCTDRPTWLNPRRIRLVFSVQSKAEEKRLVFFVNIFDSISEPSLPGVTDKHRDRHSPGSPRCTPQAQQGADTLQYLSTSKHNEELQ